MQIHYHYISLPTYYFYHIPNGNCIIAIEMEKLQRRCPLNVESGYNFSVIVLSY